MTRRVLVSPRPDQPRDRESLLEWFRRSIPPWAAQIFEQFSYIIKHLADHEITEAEITAGVTPTHFGYPPGDVRRYGAVGDGVTDDTDAINAALSVNAPVYIPAGLYQTNTLVQTHDSQIITGDGLGTILRKNANGDHFTSSGDNVSLLGVTFRGDAASPTFTGNGIVSSGNDFLLSECGSRWCPGRAVKCTGGHVQILGQSDIYQTTGTGATDYDIEIGDATTATLYHQISNIYTSQSDGGIHFINTGGQSVQGSQIGKLYVEDGDADVGANGGTYVSNRILGNVTIELSSSAFAANAFSAVTIQFVTGTSGHSFDTSNALDDSAVIDDDSNESAISDSREATLLSYTPAWTGSVSDPAIGNGSIIGRYMKVGKHVHAHIRIIYGSTSTPGSGEWRVTLPFAAATFGTQHGTVKILDSGTAHLVGVVETFSDGTAKCRFVMDGGTNTVRDGVPITFATGDELYASIDYLTN